MQARALHTQAQARPRVACVAATALLLLQGRTHTLPRFIYVSKAYPATRVLLHLAGVECRARLPTVGCECVVHNDHRPQRVVKAQAIWPLTALRLGGTELLRAAVCNRVWHRRSSRGDVPRVRIFACDLLLGFVAGLRCWASLLGFVAGLRCLASALRSLFGCACLHTHPPQGADKRAQFANEQRTRPFVGQTFASDVTGVSLRVCKPRTPTPSWGMGMGMASRSVSSPICC